MTGRVYRWRNALRFVVVLPLMYGSTLLGWRFSAGCVATAALPWAFQLWTIHYEDKHRD